MADFHLSAAPAVAHPPVEIAGTTLAPIELEGVQTLVLRPDDPDALAQEIGSAIGPLPAVGRSSSTHDDASLLRPTRDRAYLLGPPPPTGTLFYSLDQSGFWAVFALTGPGARAVLERSWKPDLHDSAFGPGAVARSTLAHIPAILWRAEAQDYRILCPRSYAISLFEDLEKSLRWVL